MDEQKRPSVKGYSGSVIKATMLRLPVLRLLAAMTARNTEIRLPYSSPVFTSGSFLLESDGTDRSASLKEISLFEQGFLGVTGVLYSNGSAVTGELVFKIPSYMVDSRRLPSGVTQEGHEIILPVKISGTPASPQDNSAGMLQEVEPRADRPGMGTAPSAERLFPLRQVPRPPALRWTDSCDIAEDSCCCSTPLSEKRPKSVPAGGPSWPASACGRCSSPSA